MLPGQGTLAAERWPVPFALGVLALLAYANAMLNGFVLDDRGIILDHPLVRDPASAWRAFITPYWPAAIGGGHCPLGILSFALDRTIAGPSAMWYHAVNVAWHGAATLLFWQWGRGFLAPAGALAAAALFAVHPVHVEAVANVVGRLELMAAAFVFAALVAHQRGSRFAPLFYALALLSKEHAIVFLPLALLAPRSPRPVPTEDSSLTSAFRTQARLWLAYALVTLAWLALMLFVVRGHPPVTSAVFRDLSTVDRMLTVLSLVPEYLRLLLFPLHLSADYEPGVVQPVHGLSLAVIPGAVVLAAYAWITIRAWRADRVAAFALLCIPVALAPVSNVFFASGVALAERTLYLPSAGVCFLGGWAVQRLGERRIAATAALAVTLLGVAGIRTWLRTPVWRDARVFAITLLEDHPESYRGHWVAGRVLLAAGDLAAAQRELTLARRIYGHDEKLNREAASVDSAMHRRQQAATRDGQPTAQLANLREGQR
jgi:hypothetical protein